MKEGVTKYRGYFAGSDQDGWMVGIYIRLSDADGNDVSLSVENQEAIIREYLITQFTGKYQIYNVYVDDGITGTTDNERRAFSRMIEDIKKGYVNCVIAKTLARSFRNYSDQGYYLEEFFPRMGTRFITLETPRVDTYANPEQLQGYELPLNGIVNGRYAEATSTAIRQTFQHMRRQGKFQGGFPPYGYVRNPEDKHSFIVDPEAAAVVKQIFDWFVTERLGYETIRQKLNDLGISNPSGYKKEKGCKYRNPGIISDASYLWRGESVKQILRNRTYLGEMVQGRCTVISYKVHKQIQVPEDQWDIVKDRHEPIIEKPVFDKAQEIIKSKGNHCYYGKEGSLLSGFIYCADCKRKMHKRRSVKINYYACSTYYKKDKNACTPHFTRHEIIEKAVLSAIQQQIERIDIDAIIDEVYKIKADKYYNHKLRIYKDQEKEVQKIQEQIENLYIDFNRRIISEQEYFKFKKGFEEKRNKMIEGLKALKAEIDSEKEDQNEFDGWLEVFKKYKNITELTRPIMEEFIDRIYVDQEKNLEIIFKFGDLFEGF